MQRSALAHGNKSYRFPFVSVPLFSVSLDNHHQESNAESPREQAHLNEEGYLFCESPAVVVTPPPPFTIIGEMAIGLFISA